MGKRALLSRHHHASPSLFDGFWIAIMSVVSIESAFDHSKIELLIQLHESKVDLAKCSRSVCSACLAQNCLVRKDIRRRKLRFFSTNRLTLILHVIVTVIRLVRWKCTLCNYTFTDYPDFRTPIQTLRFESTSPISQQLSRFRFPFPAPSNQFQKQSNWLRLERHCLFSYDPLAIFELSWGHDRIACDGR